MMAAEGAVTHREIPRGLGTFRDKEAKALAVSLVMCGIMLLMAVIPITSASDSTLVRSGVPIVTALMFTLSGTLTILTEQQPHRLLGLSATLALVLTAVMGATELVVGLADIGRLRGVPVGCAYDKHYFQCHQRYIGQATLLSSMPAVYLLTLHGTLLCAVLSAIFFELLRNWAPASNEIHSGAAAPPEGASPVLDVSGIGTPGDPQQTAGVRAAEPSRNASLGEKFLEGEPKLLGVVLLTTSFGTILLSMPDLVLSHMESVRLGLVWWSFVHSLVSGVLAVVAAGNPSLVLIRSCFVLSVLSAVVSSIVSLAYVDMTVSIYFCYIRECENSTVFTQHIFPFLLLLLTVVLCSVLAAYARKALRPLSLDKATLIVNPTPVQERGGHPALQE